MGLDNSGKTALIYKQKMRKSASTISINGSNVETLEHNMMKLIVQDLGGLPRMRSFWKLYYPKTQVVLFAVDHIDQERIAAAKGIFMIPLKTKA